MKQIIPLFTGLLIVAGTLTAGVQNYVVTPATLADWKVSGADRDKLQAQDTISLPAGAELARTFSGGAVVFYTVSSPHFGPTPGDWPVVQVGPAALALTRKGIRGELVLLVGETVSILPMDIPLDSSGNCLKPLELALGYDPVSNVGVVAFADQALSYKGTSNGPVVEVAVAAGEKKSWPHDSLEVLVIGPEDTTDDTAKGTDSADAARRAAILKSATVKLRQAGEVIGGQDGSGSATTKPPGIEAGSRLEIYTPPAVRHGAGSVRAAIAQNLKK